MSNDADILHYSAVWGPHEGMQLRFCFSSLVVLKNEDSAALPDVAKVMGMHVGYTYKYVVFVRNCSIVFP